MYVVHSSGSRTRFDLRFVIGIRAVRILKTAGWILLGCDTDVQTVGAHLLEKLGVPPSLLNWVNGGPSTQGSAQVMDTGPEGAAIEVLKLLDLRQDYMSTAEAVLLASNSGQTVLHLSASLGFKRLLKELIVRGVDPSDRDVNGYTTLHFTALFGHTNCVGTLVREGTDTDVVTVDGRTAREIALDSNHYAIAELLDPRVTAVADVPDARSQRETREGHTPPGAMVLEPNESSAVSSPPSAQWNTVPMCVNDPQFAISP